MLKSRGPRINPYGTPEINFSQIVNLLLTRTRCCLFVKKLFMKTSASSGKPYAPYLANKKSSLIVPKVFYKSMNMAQTKPPLSRVFFHFSSILTRECWVLWFFLKPVSNFDNLSSMKFSICVYMILSMIFDT